MPSALLQRKFFILSLIFNINVVPIFSSAPSNANLNYVSNNIADTNQNIQKRQISIDDLVNTALQLVRPIFDTSQTLQLDNSMIPKRITAEQSPGDRETKILGAPSFSSLLDLPICRGNSQICKFISCTAHNFKYDHNFSNLNLAAQLISDQEFRKTIAQNPETIAAVCHEQGLSTEQCKIFSRGFQFIDRVITSIQKPKATLTTNVVETEPTDNSGDNADLNDNLLDSMNPLQFPINDAMVTKSGDSLPQTPELSTPISQLSEMRQMTPIRPMNYPLTPNIAPLKGTQKNSNVIVGSHTWSTHNRQNRIVQKPKTVEPNAMQVTTIATTTTKKQTPSVIISTSATVINNTGVIKSKNVSRPRFHHTNSTRTKMATMQSNNTNRKKSRKTQNQPPRATRPVMPNDNSTTSRINRTTKEPRVKDSSILERPKQYTTDSLWAPNVSAKDLIDSSLSTDFIDTSENSPAINTNSTTQTTSQKSTIPEAEEDYEYEELLPITKFGRRKRSDDYYDTVDHNDKKSGNKPTNGGNERGNPNLNKLNCFQYLG